jgi:hypothetical protein
MRKGKCIMKQLLTNTIVWIGVTACVFVMLATCASMLNGPYQDAAMLTLQEGAR